MKRFLIGFVFFAVLIALSAGITATETPPRVRLIAGGRSNLTYLLRAGDAEVVLRSAAGERVVALVLEDPSDHGL